MPIAQDVAHRIVKTLHEIREEKTEMLYLRPDAKSQVTIEYDENNKPVKIHTIVVSTQHDPFDEDEDLMQKKIVYIILFNQENYKKDMMEYIVFLQPMCVKPLFVVRTIEIIMTSWPIVSTQMLLLI
jgi:S-adenosylmethionine synthetase